MDETFSSLFGTRLKEARKALGLNQAEAADLTGVTREHWGRCERGAAMPGGDVFVALAKAGADVRYVLTGEREIPAANALTAEERTLLTYFRDASKEVRRAALGALIGASPQQFEGSQQVFHKAPRGDVAGRDIVKGGGKR